MILSNQFLELCSEAKEKGFPLLTTPGATVGRGFADLGYEVFSCLPQRKLLSLLTGEESRLDEGQDNHFFSVPTVDQVVTALEERGVTFKSVTREDAREWRVVVAYGGGEELSVVENDLLQALIVAYIRI